MDARGGQGLRLSIGAFGDDGPRLVDRSLRADVIDLVFLEKELDAGGVLVRDVAGAADDLGPVEGEFIKGKAEFAGVPGEEAVELGVAEEGFGGDAAPVEAGAAGAFFFDTCNFFAELRGTDGSDIAGRTAADHDKIVGHRIENGRVGVDASKGK